MSGRPTQGSNVGTCASHSAASAPAAALGGLVQATLELRGALREMQLDTRLSRFVGRDIPDAAERLDYALQLSEQAAHATLERVERARAIADGLSESTLDPRVSEDMRALREHLTEIAVSQSYQDITGQIIRRVVELVRRLDTALNDLLAAAGVPADSAVPKGSELEGPQVPHAATSQSEADDLLSRLGL